MIRILFIDDDPQAQKTLKMVLSGKSTLISAYTGTQGLEMVRREGPDVVLLDINLPDRSGLEVLRDIRSRSQSPPVIMLTAVEIIETVVEAVRAGAIDYIVKPYTLKKLTAAIRQSLAAGVFTEPTLSGGTHVPEIDAIIGESPAVRQVKDLIYRFSPSISPVLILGESGTGKELVARAVHAVSRRRGRFVPVNCGAIPENLVETEMFGCVRGAYTDATDRPGSFEVAEGGTLFLDEIGEMPTSCQVKLLRVLEDKEVSRIGSATPVPLNVRVVAATHRDPADTDALRRDLFYRLGVLLIKIPPLRERPEDIPILAKYFLKEISKSVSSKDNAEMTDEARKALLEHCWMGNIRELRNVIERAVHLSKGTALDRGDIVFT